MMSIFSCICWPSLSSLEKCLLRSFAHFFNWVVCFFVIELYELGFYFLFLFSCVPVYVQSDSLPGGQVEKLRETFATHVGGKVWQKQQSIYKGVAESRW